MTAADLDAIESLAGWDTPALSNALDALRLRPCHTGYTDGSVRRITGTPVPMAGRAVTARMVARSPGSDGIAVSSLHKAIGDTAGPVVVVLEDCDDPAGAGAFLGEVNGALLAALGVRGWSPTAGYATSPNCAGSRTRCTRPACAWPAATCG